MLKCISCGSTNIVTSTCSYCGAIVSVASPNAVKAFNKEALAAFKPKSNYEDQMDLTADELSSARITNILVLLERKQWSDALKLSELCRSKMPDRIEILHYYLVSAIAGNFLSKIGTDTIRELVFSIIEFSRTGVSRSNLNGYLVACLNAAWCTPARIRLFEVPNWQSDDAIVAISSYFKDEHLLKASLLFNPDGSLITYVTSSMLSRAKRVADLHGRITDLVVEGDSRITDILNKYAIGSLFELRDRLKIEIKNSKKNASWMALIDFISSRRSKYIENLGLEGIEPSASNRYLNTISKILIDATMLSFFFGSKPEKAASDIYVRVSREISDLEKMTKDFWGQDFR
jgi:hypothetical protein